MVASDNAKNDKVEKQIEKPVESEEVRKKREDPTVKKLEELDEKYMELENEFQKKWVQLQNEYEKKQQPYIDQRKEILLSKPEGTADDKKTGTPVVPNFWLDAMKNVPALQEDIFEHDEPVLAYLKDVSCEKLPDDSGFDQKGFKLTFDFAENEYFTNKKLVRIFHTDKQSEFVNEIECIKIESDEIEWKPKKDVTIEIRQLKKRGKRPAQLKEEPRESFFRKFFRSIDPDDEEVLDKCEDLIKFQMPEEEDMEEQDPEEILEMLTDQAFELGCLLRDNIIPCAVRWYTGQATPVDEIGFDDYDDEDDDDDDDEDDDDQSGPEITELDAEDDDDDDDEDKKDDEKEKEGKKNKKKGGVFKKDANADGDKVNTEECKQQ